MIDYKFIEFADDVPIGSREHAEAYMRDRIVRAIGETGLGKVEVKVTTSEDGKTAFKIEGPPELVSKILATP